MDTAIVTYLAYLVICVPMAVAVGSTLHKNGRVFLVEVFGDREDVADSVNHLLLVGFYLLSIGFVSVFTRVGGTPNNETEMVEWLTTKVGAVLIVLGVVHMFNVRVFASLRKRFVPDDREPEPPRPRPTPREPFGRTMPPDAIT